MQLSSIHTTTFFHNCNDIFQQFYIWATIFTTIFFRKVFAVSCVVCKELNCELQRRCAESALGQPLTKMILLVFSMFLESIRMDLDMTTVLRNEK